MSEPMEINEYMRNGRNIVPSNRPDGLYVYDMRYGGDGAWVHSSGLDAISVSEQDIEDSLREFYEVNPEEKMTRSGGRRIVPGNQPLGLYIYIKDYEGGSAWVHESVLFAASRTMSEDDLPEFILTEEGYTMPRSSVRKVIPASQPLGLYIYNKDHPEGPAWVHHLYN